MATTSLSSRPVTTRRTTIALKLLMAVTGLFFVFYVLMHMYGNLKILVSHEAFNTYAEHLRTFGEPMLPYGGLLWIFRILLIASLVGHAYSAFALWSRAAGARPNRYAVATKVWQSKAMRWGGVFLLIFVAWHLLHFTIVKPQINLAGPAREVLLKDPAAMVIASFQIWWMVLLYLAALLALGLHLEHGVFSAQQTLGYTQTAKSRLRAKVIAHAIAGIVTLGFAIPPVAILLGLVK